ncbi:7837_t:CDS:2, partial [Dentiscutata heterogama]
KVSVHHQVPAEISYIEEASASRWRYQSRIKVKKVRHKVFNNYLSNADHYDKTNSEIAITKIKEVEYYLKTSEVNDTSDETFQIGFCCQDGMGVKKMNIKSFSVVEKPANTSNT